MEKQIKQIEYHHDLSRRTTIAIITLHSGWEVVGVSSTVDPTNYDSKLGEKYAYADAMSKLEPLEAYFKHEFNYRTKEQ